MKQLTFLIQEIKQEYFKIDDLENRQLCFDHHQRVAEYAKQLDPNNNCLIIAAYLHDIGLYLGLRGKHAQTSSEYARTFLTQTHRLEANEIERIVEMIRVHSDKKTVHSVECETLKEADHLAHQDELL